MPKDFGSLVRELKFLKEAENQAKINIEDAERTAEVIVREAEEEAATLVSQGESDTRKAALEMQNEMEREVASEVSNLDRAFLDERKRIQGKADKNMEEAVSYVLNSVLKIST